MPIFKVWVMTTVCYHWWTELLVYHNYMLYGNFPIPFWDILLTIIMWISPRWYFQLLFHRHNILHYHLVNNALMLFTCCLQIDCWFPDYYLQNFNSLSIQKLEVMTRSCGKWQQKTDFLNLPKGILNFSLNLQNVTKLHLLTAAMNCNSNNSWQKLTSTHNTSAISSKGT